MHKDAFALFYLFQILLAFYFFGQGAGRNFSGFPLLLLPGTYFSHTRRLLSQVKLHFTEDALRLIAKKAISKNTGARGLRSILESILMDAMYEVCNSSLSISVFG